MNTYGMWAWFGPRSFDPSQKQSMGVMMAQGNNLSRICKRDGTIKLAAPSSFRGGLRCRMGRGNTVRDKIRKKCNFRKSHLKSKANFALFFEKCTFKSLCNKLYNYLLLHYFRPMLAHYCGSGCWMTAAAPQIVERKDNNNQVKTEGTD